MHYAAAARVAEQLSSVFSVGQSGPASLLRVVADDTSNRLLIIGTEAGRSSALELLRRIDVPPAAEGRLHVVALEHAVAEELEQTLSRLLVDTGSGDPKQPARLGSFEGAVRVTASALIVNASTHDYAELRPVLDELDRRPRQVFIDAVVLDLSSDDRSRLGIGYHGAGSASLLGQASSLIFGGVNAAQSTPNSSQLQALALGVRGPDLEGSEGLFGGDAAGVSIPAFGVALQALAQSSTSDVLATPHIIALDSTTPEIFMVLLMVGVGPAASASAGRASIWADTFRTDVTTPRRSSYDTRVDAPDQGTVGCTGSGSVPFTGTRSEGSARWSVISTRRFSALPSVVELLATGLLSPRPTLTIREDATPWPSR